eukprot:Hpha_TRINITY_DN15377_c3_g3::TRINITY_DN15377_c3_g3_i1::g.88523::m.88523
MVASDAESDCVWSGEEIEKQCPPPACGQGYCRELVTRNRNRAVLWPPALCGLTQLTAGERRLFAAALLGISRSMGQFAGDLAKEVAQFWVHVWGWRHRARELVPADGSPLSVAREGCGGVCTGDLAWLGHSRALAAVPLSKGVWEWSIMCSSAPDEFDDQPLCGWAIGVARGISLEGDPGDDEVHEGLLSDRFVAATASASSFFYAGYHSDGTVLLRREGQAPGVGDDDGTADFGHPEYREGDLVTVRLDMDSRVLVFSVNGTPVHRIGGDVQDALWRGEEDETEDRRIAQEALGPEVFPMVGLSGGAVARIVSYRRVK